MGWQLDELNFGRFIKFNPVSPHSQQLNPKSLVATGEQGQRLAQAYTVLDKRPVKAHENIRGEIMLSGIDWPDKAVTILAIQLNKELITP
jgi:hypothetical protein